ncbi:DUF1513 domain-containing protein [Vibrio makurazakiensis]|uniref:DUF1513 domain-containing protein n=1 Tax=Vibrio makurazakiensis TaxID=2910250 RepID=UPI003D0DCAB1
MVTNDTRRTLLKAALLGAASPLLPFGCASTQKAAGFSNSESEPSLIGCSIAGKGKFSAVVANKQGYPIHTLPVPERGHGVAINPVNRHAVVFARRPGTYFMVFDYFSGETITLKPSGRDRHFYGHGVYSNDGSLLYATEGESRTSKGIIGVYDVANQYRKIDEFTDFGLGPHEVIIMPDDRLVIGVGGVDTDGRTPKNLDTMRPSLSYLSADGKLLEQATLSDKKLSIRHLAHDGSETVLCGQQYRGEPDEYPPLLAMHTRGGKMEMLDAEPEQWARFNHYIASIAATEDWIIATSPRGNCYGIWSKETKQLVELAALPDASGAVVFDSSFLLSSGAGDVVSQSEPKQKTVTKSGVQWDNHWSSI